MKVTLFSYTRPTEALEGVGVVSLGDLIAYVARVSNPGNQANTLTAPKLIQYLKTHGHWSPFEMVHVCVKIQTTRDISHQIVRHRSFSFQEFSQRYAEVTEDAVFREPRLQDSKNRQNSLENTNSELAHLWEYQQREIAKSTSRVYRWALDNGIAKEQARAVLPEGLTPTTLYMSGSVRSWIHYVQVRSDPSTQKEHRLIAEEARGILKELGIES